MAAIDKDLDEEEERIIREFIETHWRPEYGDIELFIGGLDQETVNIVFSEVSAPPLNEKIDAYVASLKELLTVTQREAFLAFIERVMVADDFINPMESELYHRYKLIV